MPRSRQIRYQAQQRYKKLLETFTWGFGARRDKILAYERSVASLGRAH
jgi:hypothetical protein